MASLDLLQEGTRLTALAQLELEAKGYPTGLVMAALSRASGSAEFRVRDIQDPKVKILAYIDILTAEIGRSEAWILKTQDFLDGHSDKAQQEGGD